MLAGKPLVLGQGIGDVEPRCLRADKDVAGSPYSWIVIKRAHHDPDHVAFRIGRTARECRTTPLAEDPDGAGR